MSSNLGSFEVHNLAPCIDDRFPPNQNQILTAVASAHLARHDDANCNDSTVHQQAQVVVCRESAAEDICPLQIFRNEDQYKQQEVLMSSAADFVQDENSYEPMRRVANPAPPKRFFRTFWRSVTRRLIERESQLRSELSNKMS